MDAEIDIRSGMDDVFDSSNESEHSRPDYDIKIVDGIRVSSQMKWLFMLCCFIGMIIAYYYAGAFASVIWLVVAFFIADLTGIFEIFAKRIRELDVPRGRYDNIE